MLRAQLRVASLLLAALSLIPAANAQFGVAGVDQMALSNALDVGSFTIQSLTAPDTTEASVTVDVSLAGVVHTLALQPWSIRSADHFEVLMQGADGELTPYDVGPSKLWRGVVLGIPGSRVSADFSNGQVDALIRLGSEDAVWAIQPLTDVDASAAREDHVVYSSEDNIDRGYSCGGALQVHGSDPAPAPSGGWEGLANDEICEIACDADVEFYNKNGSSVANTEADIENIIDRVQNIYQPDVSILYEITTIIVRTAEPDPYSSTSAGTLLNQFQSHWNGNHAGIQRDVAHLFTGKNIAGGTIGVAYLNVICNLGSAYGLSESKFTSNLSFRTGLTAHELGHNWAAGHCDGAGDCWIMCSGIGGCAGSVTKFGQGSKNSITNKKNSVNCLDNAVPPLPPVLASVSPSTSVALGQQVTVFGTGLSEANFATVGGQQAAVVLQSDTQCVVVAPGANALGPVSLTITNDGGTSNSITLTYVAANPPVFTAPTVINTAFDTTATWSFATAPGDLCFFLVDLDIGTFLYKGFNVLLSDIPPIQLIPNAAGVGSLVAPIDPSMGGVGLYSIYTQMAFLNPGLYHVTPVKITVAF